MIFYGLLVGIYGYTLFLLGIVGLLSGNATRLVSLVALCCFLFFFFQRKVIRPSFLSKKTVRDNLFTVFLVLLLLCLALINLVGALGPELAYDALWYHLTLPKMYLAIERLSFVPGGLLYYSAMPQFAELLYVGGLTVGGEVFPKITHFFFGICTLVLIYNTARLFVSKKLSFFACLVFYANLVVAWESTTAYVDLVWTFFQMGSLYLLLAFLKEKKKNQLYLSAIFVGLAISVKLLAIGGLVLLLFTLLYARFWSNKNYHLRWRDFFIAAVTAIIIPLPWFLFSFFHTGNPVYPFFTPIYPAAIYPFSADNIVFFFSSFLFSADPISPLYLICFPLIILYAKYFTTQEKILVLIGFLFLLLWFISPKSGGGRFIMASLPLFSVIIAVLVAQLEKKRKVWLYKAIIGAGVFLMCVSIVYRGVANSKYTPVLLGKESRELFLGERLNFSFGDFYDTDKFFTENIKREDVVFLIGFHNLYYADFPYIDQSWVRKGDKFTYIAVQNTVLPKRFSAMKKVYENKRTRVSVFKGEKAWIY